MARQLRWKVGGVPPASTLGVTGSHHTGTHGPAPQCGHWPSAVSGQALISLTVQNLAAHCSQYTVEQVAR